MNKLTLIVLLIISSLAFSQNIKLEGVILEKSNSQPLEMANIMAVNQDTKAMDAYAITNDKGKFILNLKANANYSIKVSYIGMQNKELVLETKSQNIIQNIVLEEGEASSRQCVTSSAFGVC